MPARPVSPAPVVSKQAVAPTSTATNRNTFSSVSNPSSRPSVDSPNSQSSAQPNIQSRNPAGSTSSADTSSTRPSTTSANSPAAIKQPRQTISLPSPSGAVVKAPLSVFRPTSIIDYALNITLPPIDCKTHYEEEPMNIWNSVAETITYADQGNEEAITLTNNVLRPDQICSTQEFPGENRTPASTGVLSSMFPTQESVQQSPEIKKDTCQGVAIANLNSRCAEIFDLSNHSHTPNIIIDTCKQHLEDLVFKDSELSKYFSNLMVEDYFSSYLRANSTNNQLSLPQKECELLGEFLADNNKESFYTRHPEVKDYQWHKLYEARKSNLNKFPEIKLANRSKQNCNTGLSKQIRGFLQENAKELDNRITKIDSNFYEAYINFCKQKNCRELISKDLHDKIMDKKTLSKQELIYVKNEFRQLSRLHSQLSMYVNIRENYCKVQMSPAPANERKVLPSPNLR